MYDNGMKYLGIDYGEKRVGIATSDDEGKIAFPKVVLENSPELIKEIIALCTDNKIEAIVIGESHDYKGEENKINPKIISFKKDLMKEVSLPTFLEPEFMSSMQVEKTFGKTDMLDASAAAIILQTYLDKEKNREVKKEETESNRMKITIDDFARVEMRVGKILSVEEVPGSDKLLKCMVDFREGQPRQILSGIRKYFPDTSVLVGKKVAYVTNLLSRKMMGFESDGMVMAVHSGDSFALMEVPDSIEIGTKIG